MLHYELAIRNKKNHYDVSCYSDFYAYKCTGAVFIDCFELGI